VSENGPNLTAGEKGLSIRLDRLQQTLEHNHKAFYCKKFNPAAYKESTWQVFLQSKMII